MIIEKPFGHDGASARALNKEVLEVFDESQVYRIDHYLGKETVQNMLVLRFGNGIFEPLWNRNYIDHVQITASETLGVEERAAFYESAGALRDMVQSHMLQLTSLVAMEAPARFDATSVRNEKIKVLQSIRPISDETVWNSVVRGQYGAGQINGKPVPAYRQEPGVKPDSVTETFVALKLQVDNWRWNGVPFYLRTGKAAGQVADRSNHPVQASAAHGVSQRRTRTEFAGPEHSTGRRDFSFVRGKSSWRADADSSRGDELRISQSFRRGHAGRLRHPDQRLHTRRCDPVRSRG